MAGVSLADAPQPRVKLAAVSVEYKQSEAMQGPYLRENTSHRIKEDCEGKGVAHEVKRKFHVKACFGAMFAVPTLISLHPGCHCG